MVIRSLQYGAISNVVSHVSRAATASVASGGTLNVSAITATAPTARTAPALLLPRSPSIAPQASVRALDLTASSFVVSSTFGTGTIVLTAPAPSPSSTPQASNRSFLSSAMTTAATANTPLLALGASGNLSGAKSDSGNGPSLVLTASGRTVNGNPIGTAALAGIAALLACSAGTGNPAACDGPGKGKPTKLNLTKKPETEWPRDKKTGKLTTAVSHWKRHQEGKLPTYPLNKSKAEKKKYAKNHGGAYEEYLTLHGIPLGVLSLEALEENVDELTAPQIRAALKGNEWPMTGNKDAQLKTLKDALADPDNAREYLVCLV